MHILSASRAESKTTTNKSLARSVAHSVGRFGRRSNDFISYLLLLLLLGLNLATLRRVESNPFGLVRNNAVSQLVALNDGLLSSDDGFV